MAGIAKLTAQRVARLVEPGRYGDGGGLWLQVRGPQKRSWIFRYARGGKAHWMGLGDLSTVTLAEAREAALQCRKWLLEGRDPLAARNEHRSAMSAAQKTAPSFREMAERYIASHAAGWRSKKTPDQWRNSLENHVFRVIGNVPVDEIDTRHVTDVLEGLWTTRPETASRIRNRIESILDYARTRGHRTGENPARWRGHLENLFPKRSKVRPVEHFEALPWRSIGAFMEELADESGVGPLALRFVILTGARSGEARGATWGEIDMERGVWTVPAPRMKAGREHRVPLSDAALAILREVAMLSRGRPEDLVFPGAKAGRPLSDMSLTAVLRRMGRTITVHGFRSTFRDWCAEATNYPREIAEAALAHMVRDKTEAAYQRGDLFDKRARLMAEWGEFCSRTAPAAGEVVALRPVGAA